MAVLKKHSIWFIALSCLKLAVGIALLVICKGMSTAIAQYEYYPNHPIASLWWIPALPFFMTGAFGFLATKIKHRAVTGVHMALNIFSMVVTPIFVWIALEVIILHSYFHALNSFEQWVFNLLYGATAMLFIGWFLCLAASITSCSACCCCCYSQTSGPNAVHVHPGDYGFPVGAIPPISCIMPGVIEQAKEMPIKDNYEYSRMP